MSSGLSVSSLAPRPPRPFASRYWTIMPGAEILDLRSADPGGRKTARHAGGAQLFRRFKRLGPGLGRLVRIKPSLFEKRPVPIDHRGRTVEREGQHFAVLRAVIGSDRRQVGT